MLDDMRSCCAGIVHVGSERRLLDTEGNEIAGVRTEIAETRGELCAEISRGIAGQTRWIVGYITAWSGVALARWLF